MLMTLAQKPWRSLALPLVVCTSTTGAIAAPSGTEVTQHLPANLAYVILLDQRADTWQQLDQFALFQTWQAQTGEPLGPGRLPFFPPELDYATEIAPWLGSVTAQALLPLAQPQATPLAEHEVLLAPIAQPERFPNFIPLVTTLRGKEPQALVYQGVEILYWEPEFLEAESFPEGGVSPTPATVDVSPKRRALPDSLKPWVEGAIAKAPPAEVPTIPLPEAPIPDIPGLAIAVFPDLLVAAQHPAALRAWIDLRPATANDSLAADPNFQRTLAHPQYESSLGVFYGNAGELLKYSPTNFSLPGLPIPIPLPSELTPQDIAEIAARQFDTPVEMLLYPTPQGLRVQGRGYFNETLRALLGERLQTPPKPILSPLPDTTYGFLSGHGIAQAWQSLSTGLSASAPPETGAAPPADWLTQARTFFQLLTGLDLDRDVFGWMDQGFTVFLFPTKESPLTLFWPELEVGLGVALQTSDRATAENTLTRLEQAFGNNFVPVTRHEVNGLPVTSWALDINADAQPDSFLGYGWATEDTLLLTTSLGSLRELLTQGPEETLPYSRYFQRATQDFPARPEGYLYVDMGPTRSLFFRLFPPEVMDSGTTEVRQLIGTIQALSGAVSFSEDFVQLDGLLLLSPTPSN